MTLVINSQNPKIVISSSLVFTRYSPLRPTLKYLLIANRKDAEDAELGDFPFAAERTAKGKLLSPVKRDGKNAVPSFYREFPQGER